MALIRGNLKTVKDVTEARNVLKQIANNPKFTEYGAKRLVKWHRKLTALAFAQQKDPDTGEEWAAPGFKTAKDGRFSKHLLMRSGALIKAATNPNVTLQTREGVSTATIKMPGEPFYAEFHQFGTSSIHKNSALVFQHDQAKRLETSYKRSTRTPARPFFPFASDNFSNYAAGKEIEKTALVVFEAVSKSILKRAIQLPTAEIEGYTSVVSFYTTAPMKARTAKSGRVVKAKNGAGQVRHARLDARLVGRLYTTKGAQFHSELTESLQPPPKGPRNAKSLRHEHYREVHRQSLLYRHARHAEFAEQEAAAGAEGWRKAAQHLRKFQEKYLELERRLGLAVTAEERASLRQQLEDLRTHYALEQGFVFRQSERAEEGGGRAALNELVTRYNQRKAALEKRLNDEEVSGKLLETTKAKIRREVAALTAEFSIRYAALAGKREPEPILIASLRNAKQLAIENEKRTITFEIHEELGFNRGGRPERTEEHKARTHERYLARRRQDYLEKQAARTKVTPAEYEAERARKEKERAATQAKIDKYVRGAMAGKTVIINRAGIGAFYKQITAETLSTAEKQLRSAELLFKQGKIEEAILKLHRSSLTVRRETIERAAHKAAEAEASAPKPPKAPPPPKAPKAPPAETGPKPAAPKPPKAASAPKPAERPMSAPPPLSEADKHHNTAVRQSITQLNTTKKALKTAGNTEGVTFIDKQIEAMKATIRTEGRPPPVKELNATQKMVLPHLQRRISQLERRATVLHTSVQQLREDRYQAAAKGYTNLAQKLDAKAKRRDALVNRITRRLIPQLNDAFLNLTETALVTARAAKPPKKGPGPTTQITSRPK